MWFFVQAGGLGLVMEHVGEKLYPTNRRTEDDILSVQAAFRKLWQYGLIHGDVAWRNVAMSGGTAKIIDLGNATRASGRAIKHERLQLQEMLAPYTYKLGMPMCMEPIGSEKAHV